MTKQEKTFVFLVFAMCALAMSSNAVGSPFIPGSPQSGPIAIVGATIHPVSSEPISAGTILFEGGKITAIGRQVPLPNGTEKIDARGKHVYPGLINAAGQLGLVEINSVPATVDSSEMGSLNPNVRVEKAINPDSELIPVTRANGVLISWSIPRGGLISGQSAVMQWDGWTYEDMTLKSRAGMHVNWPSDANPSSGRMKELISFFGRAHQYRDKKSADPDSTKIDLRMEAMLPVLSKDVPLVAHADTEAQIRSAVGFAVDRGLRLIIYGGYDAEHCGSMLKRFDIPVVVSRVYRLPRRRSEAFDSAYTLPNRLRLKGVRFCIAGDERFGASNLRNLPYHAATSVAYGLPEKYALKAITEFPAQILGLSEKVGTLEVGKDATLIVTNGNPLEIATATEIAFIGGRRVDLRNRQLNLERKYRAKYKSTLSND